MHAQSSRHHRQSRGTMIVPPHDTATGEVDAPSSFNDVRVPQHDGAQRAEGPTVVTVLRKLAKLVDVAEVTP